ncbi:MAG: nucleotide sugar dehydrogenase [Alphaproteobacteria bacterium]|nr:nucleotide sugar dehydrogenase [Alphaproteobacteria bacterium]
MKVSIIGLGKLGSPMAAVYASKGFEVIGVDKNPTYVESINAGKAHVDEPQLQEFIDAHKGRLTATLDTKEAVKKTDVTFVIVPTPSGPDGTFTNKYVLEAMNEVGVGLKDKSDYHLVVVTSTVMPGSTNGEIKQALENASGKKVGEKLGLCYSPEFIALGSVIRDMLYPDFFLIGESDEKAGALLEKIYMNACSNSPRVERMNFVNAEITKISVNTYVTTKISYANMLSEMCDYLENADVNVVTQAIGCDSRIGHKYLKGGVAYGGPCFPRDNVAFGRLADQLEANASIAVATDSINKGQKDRVLKMINALNNKPKKIGILGLSYKPGTPVIEESQGISLAVALVKSGYEVVVYDPMAMPAAKAVLNDSVDYATSVEDCIKKCDSAVLMTAWSEFSEIKDDMFSGKEKEFVIIDCWRVFTKSMFKNVEVVYQGAGFLAHSQEKKVLNARAC